MAKVRKEKFELAKLSEEEDKLFNPKDLPPLSPEDKKKGEAAYMDRMKYFHGTEREALRCLLKVYWERGEFAAKLIRTPGHFGNNTVGKFSRDMGCSVEHARSWYRFYVTYGSMSDVSRLIDSGIPWRKVCILTTVHDEKKRRELETKANEISSDELQEEALKFKEKAKAKAKKEGKKLPDRGGCKPRAAFANLAGFCEGPFAKRLAHAMAALEEMKGLDPKFFERAKETKIKAEESLVALVPEITKFLEEAKLVN